MNHQEIEACVIGAKSGNQEELLKLFNQYKPFIYKTANQFNIRNHETHDLIQIGYIALTKAVQKYRTGSSTFSSYAYNSITNAFRYTARQNKKYSRDLSLNLSVDAESGLNTEFIECIDSLENLDANIIKSEKLRELRRAVTKLPNDELELVNEVYYSGSSLKAYAEKKGINYLQVVGKKNKILEKLNSSMKN